MRKIGYLDLAVFAYATYKLGLKWAIITEIILIACRLIESLYVWTRDLTPADERKKQWDHEVSEFKRGAFPMACIFGAGIILMFSPQIIHWVVKL